MNRSPMLPGARTSEQRIEEVMLPRELESLSVLQLYDELVDLSVVRLGVLQVDGPLAR
jgi:hypothetical protein